MYTSALDNYAVKAIADSEKTIPSIVLQAYKATSKTQDKIENDLIQMALKDENTASDILYPSPRRKTYRSIRPSHDVRPIDNSQRFPERRLTPLLRSSHGVQSITSQIALSVVIKTVSNPRAIVSELPDSSLIKFLSENDHISSSISRKRTIAEKTSKTVKRVRESDKDRSLVLIRYNH